VPSGALKGCAIRRTERLCHHEYGCFTKWETYTVLSEGLLNCYEQIRSRTITDWTKRSPWAQSRHKRAFSWDRASGDKQIIKWGGKFKVSRGSM
jgi:hypothetical protein